MKGPDARELSVAKSDAKKTGLPAKQPLPDTITQMRRMTLLEPLPESDLLQNFKDGAFRTRTFAKNSVIHFDGEPCTRLEIILSGLVVINRIDESGNLLTISEFASNDILGGNLLFSRNPCYPMTVSTLEPTVVLEIGREALFRLFRQNERFLRTYLEYVSDHASILGDRIKHYINRTIRESVLNYLKFESRKQNSRRIFLDMSKKQLAERIGIQRTSLSRELAKMRQDGLIVFDTDSITLL